MHGMSYATDFCSVIACKGGFAKLNWVRDTGQDCKSRFVSGDPSDATAGLAKLAVKAVAVGDIAECFQRKRKSFRPQRSVLDKMIPINSSNNSL